MKLKAVKKYNKPTYPNQKEFNPTEFKQYPFLSKTAITAAISLLFISSVQNNNGINNKSKIEYVDMSKDRVPVDKEVKQVQTFHAPVFDHGDGRGAVGCVVINHPAFISEIDVRNMILESFAKKGIVFDESKKLIEGLDNRAFKNIYNEKSSTNNDENSLSLTPITIDYFSTKNNLGFILVDEEDYCNYITLDYYSSVKEFDNKEIASFISKEIEKINQFNCAIIYYPNIRVDHPIVLKKTVDIKKKLEKYHEMGRQRKHPTPEELIDFRNLERELKNKEREYSEEVLLDSLKAQVDDFLEWYQKENKKTGAKK